MRGGPQDPGGHPMLSRHFAASVAAGALAAAFFAPAAYAQQTTASLRGVAVDDAGAPIAGVSVTIVHKPSGTKTTLVTDAAGVFHVAVPFAGWWGFAALTNAPETILKDGAEKKIERGAVLWTKFVEPKRKKK